VHYLTAPSDGGTHSAGIENHDGTIGLQYYRGTASLPNELAVCYLYPGETTCGSGGNAEWLEQMPNTGTVEPGETFPVSLVFDAAAVTQSGTYTAEVYFAGTFNNMVTPMTVVMHVEPPEATIDLTVTVGLDPDVCGTESSLNVEAGTVVYYCYTVVNTGDIMLPDHTITDTVFGHIDTFIYDLMPGEVESVIYPQTITETVVSVVSWTASHAGVGVSATAEDTITVVVYSYGVVLTPATAAQSAAPGGTVTYTLSITNTGNITDVFTFADSGNNWAVGLPMTVTLGAGDSADVMVTVTIPLTAADGTVDTVTVTATSVGDGTKSASSDLTTTAVITEYRLFLPIIMKP
jgi:hypothetical protein